MQESCKNYNTPSQILVTTIYIITHYKITGNSIILLPAFTLIIYQNTLPLHSINIPKCVVIFWSSSLYNNPTIFFFL